MASITEAMKWYSSPSGLKAARLKYHYKVEFFSSKYTDLQKNARLIFDTVRTVELPKYSIETEVVNAWNVRQLVPTKINFEPISIAFTDTLDNRFQNFLSVYMNTVSNSFQPVTQSVRTGFDGFGLRSLATDADCPLDKIEITQFYGADQDNAQLENTNVITVWRPKIVDVQHDTLDYSSSDAMTWQLGIRYESVTYTSLDSAVGAQSIMTIETNQYDIIYGKLLGLGFGIDKARSLAKSLYEIAKELNLTVGEILKYVTANGVRFDNTIYAKLNSQRTNSSQLGFIDETNIPPAIRQQVV